MKGLTKREAKAYFTFVQDMADGSISQMDAMVKFSETVELDRHEAGKLISEIEDFLEESGRFSRKY